MGLIRDYIYKRPHWNNLGIAYNWEIEKWCYISLNPLKYKKPKQVNLQKGFNTSRVSDKVLDSKDFIELQRKPKSLEDICDCVEDLDICPVGCIEWWKH